MQHHTKILRIDLENEGPSIYSIARLRSHQVRENVSSPSGGFPERGRTSPGQPSLFLVPLALIREPSSSPQIFYPLQTNCPTPIYIRTRQPWRASSFKRPTEERCRCLELALPVRYHSGLLHYAEPAVNTNRQNQPHAAPCPNLHEQMSVGESVAPC